MAFHWIKLVVPLSVAMLAACQSNPTLVQDDNGIKLQQCEFSELDVSGQQFSGKQFSGKQFSGKQFSGKQFSRQEKDDLLKMARRVQAKTAIKSESLSEQATIIWQTRQDGSQHIRLHGPLGSHAVELEFDQYQAVLIDNKGRRFQRASAEALLSEIIDWPLPIEALQYWMLGKPLPEQACQFKADSDGKIVVLMQNGWQVQYQDYRSYAEYVLPRKITASSTIDNKEVMVKLVVREWQWH